jgi:hypothetical protein
MGVLQTICLGWPWTSILPISDSQMARIIGMSHHTLPSIDSSHRNWVHLTSTFLFILGLFFTIYFLSNYFNYGLPGQGLVRLLKTIMTITLPPYCSSKKGEELQCSSDHSPGHWMGRLVHLSPVACGAGPSWPWSQERFEDCLVQGLTVPSFDSSMTKGTRNFVRRTLLHETLRAQLTWWWQPCSCYITPRIICYLI